MNKQRLVWSLLGVVLAGGAALGAEEAKARFFSYRSFWPEFGAMRQCKDAGVNTACVFAANTDNSLGQPLVP